MKNNLFFYLTISCLLIMSCQDGCNELNDFPPKIYLVLADGDTISQGQRGEIQVTKGDQVAFEFFAKDDFGMKSLSYRSLFSFTHGSKNTVGGTSKDSLSFIWDSERMSGVFNKETITLSATDYENPAATARYPIVSDVYIDIIVHPRDSQGGIASSPHEVGAQLNEQHGPLYGLAPDRVFLPEDITSAALQAQVDLVFLVDEELGAVFIAPDNYYAESHYPFIASWATRNATRFKRLTNKTLPEIDNPQILTDLWQDTNEPASAIAYPLQQGDMFVFADPSGKLGLVYVEGIPPALVDGSLEIKILKE